MRTHVLPTYKPGAVFGCALWALGCRYRTCLSPRSDAPMRRGRWPRHQGQQQLHRGVVACLGRVLINAPTLEGPLLGANRTYCAHSELFRF